jgi:hypothetical protein
MLAVVVVTFAGGAALAQETCDSKAVGKNGKPLAGAAKTSFMKKCMADTCATKAVSQEGKPLSGANNQVAFRSKRTSAGRQHRVDQSRMTPMYGPAVRCKKFSTSWR